VPTYTYAAETISVSNAPVGASNEDFLVDLNGDGRLDLVVANTTLLSTPSALQVFLGDGKGGFIDGSETIFGGNAPEMIAPRADVIADFNGDGKPDLFFGDFGYDAPPFPGATNTLILSSGPSGRYAQGQAPTLLDLTHTVAAADVDGNGGIDIFVGNVNNGPGQEASYLLLNDAHGHFTLTRANLSADASLPHTASAFVDVNGDGHPDLFLGGDLGGPTGDIRSEVLLNDGRGNFFQSIDLPKPAGRIVVDAEAVDLNGDGRADLVLSETTNGSVGGYLQVLINNAHGFTDETSSWLPGQPNGEVDTSGGWVYRVLVGDLNGDGLPDLFLSEGADQALASPFFLNDGAGQLIRTAVSLPGLGQYDKVAIGDVNGDGVADVVAVQANSSGERLRVFTASLPHVQSGDGLLMGAGGGDTTLTGGTGADTFHSFSGAGLDIVTDFTLAEGDHVLLDPGTTYTLSFSGADTLIDMGNGDQLVLKNVHLDLIDHSWISG
jgi:hypothetical protein